MIDVSDPAQPEIVGTVSTGTLDLYQGPIFDALGLIDLPAEVARRHRPHRLVRRRGTDYVYLAGTAAGIDIVDLSDPTEPEIVGNFPAEEATGGVASHDVQFDQAGLRVDRRLRRHRGLRRERPAAPRARRTTPTRRASQHATPTTRRATARRSTTTSTTTRMRIKNGSLAAPPAGADPAADSDVVLITEEDYNRPTCAGAGSFETWRIGDGDKLHATLDALRRRGRRRRRRALLGALLRRARRARRARAATSRARASSTSPTRPTRARSATGSRRRT